MQGIEIKDQRKYRDYSTEPELRSLKVLFGLYAFLWFSSFLMPQYFGVHILFDFTCTRVADILLLLYMILNPRILTHFVYTCFRAKGVLIPLLLYLAVCGYTMVLRADINTFFLPFMEILTFFFVIYGVRFVIGYNRAIRWTMICAYILSAYGLVEYVAKESLMLRFLRTMRTVAGNSYRSGQYRIMGPCQHALGYGLLLLLFLALASYDYRRKKVFLFQRPVLLILLLVNVVLTGSRSTLGVAALEIVLILLISDRDSIKRSMLIIFAGIVVLGGYLLLFSHTNIARTILLSITSVLDQILGTNLSVQYGGDATKYTDSSNYRDLLPRIFTLDWLHPLVGRGSKKPFSVAIDGYFIRSIDNYYIHQYIKYAYPGMISYAIFILSTFVYFIRQTFCNRLALQKLILVGTFCYFLNLWWVDALQTLKFVYSVIAIFFALSFEISDSRKWGGQSER